MARPRAEPDAVPWRERVSQSQGSEGPFFPFSFTRESAHTLVRFYLIFGTPRSLQIFLAKSSSISLCLGTAERLFWLGWCHHECRPPSLSNSHPCLLRCRRSSSRFIRRSALLQTLHLQPRVPRDD
jgi:hypothetical protein